jgi:DNA-binding transcriptional regulator YhcF (GntR family)
MKRNNRNSNHDRRKNKINKSSRFAIFSNNETSNQSSASGGSDSISHQNSNRGTDSRSHRNSNRGTRFNQSSASGGSDSISHQNSNRGTDSRSHRNSNRGSDSIRHQNSNRGTRFNQSSASGGSDSISHQNSNRGTDSRSHRNSNRGTRFNQSSNSGGSDSRSYRNSNRGTRFNQQSDNINLKQRGNNSLEDHLKTTTQNNRRDNRNGNRRDNRNGNRRDNRHGNRRDNRYGNRRGNRRDNRHNELLEKLKKPIFNTDIKSDTYFPSLSNDDLTNNTQVIEENWTKLKETDVVNITDEQIKIIESDKKKNIQQKKKEIAIKLIEEKEEQKNKELDKLIYDIECSKNNFFVKERLLNELKEEEGEDEDMYESDNESVCSVDSFYDPDNEDPFWDYEYWPMRNPKYNYQCIYEQDNYGEIYKKWVGIRETPSFDNEPDKYTHMEPEDFGNYHPYSDKYVDPRIDALYAKYGEDIEIGFNKVINLTILRSRFRPVYPIFSKSNTIAPKIINLKNSSKEYEPNWINLTERFNKRLAEGKIFTYDP